MWKGDWEPRALTHTHTHIIPRGLFSITQPLGNLWVFITSWWRPLSDLFTYAPLLLPWRDICCSTEGHCVWTVSLVMRPRFRHASHAFRAKKKRKEMKKREKSARDGEKGSGGANTFNGRSQVQSIGSMQVYCNHIMGNQIALSPPPSPLLAPPSSYLCALMGIQTASQPRTAVFAPRTKWAFYESPASA